MAACRDALAAAFIQTDAQELLTMVPGNMPHARLLARRMGFRHLFDRKSMWPAAGLWHDMAFYAMSLPDWAATGPCAAAGRRFHQRLHHELGAHAHAEDAVHDAFVGVAVEMILAGNVMKAIDTYNRWARFALYEPVRVVSTDPLRIDIKQCVLRVEGDQFFMEAHHA